MEWLGQVCTQNGQVTTQAKGRNGTEFTLETREFLPMILSVPSLGVGQIQELYCLLLPLPLAWGFNAPEKIRGPKWNWRPAPPFCQKDSDWEGVQTMGEAPENQNRKSLADLTPLPTLEGNLRPGKGRGLPQGRRGSQSRG